MTPGTSIYHFVPDEFLPRLKRAQFGSFAAGPYAHRWFGRITRDRIPIVVLSKRPEQGRSVHLVADRLGRWLAYSHDLRSGRRTRLGNSAHSFYLAREFRVA